MSNINRIQEELIRFKRKYWFAKLLQGILIFSGTGLVWLALALIVEYVSWLNVTQRTFLFWVTVLIETVLLSYYIFWPAIQLLIKGRALSDDDAAILIGNQIKGVDDKLMNYLQLSHVANKNELIDAGLTQKEFKLLQYPFTSALSFSFLKPFLLFLILPVFLVVFFVSGNRWHIVAEGADRLVNYNTEFQKQFPFEVSFSKELFVKEGEDFESEVFFTGDYLPDEVNIHSSVSRSMLQKSQGNSYRLYFRRVTEDVSFEFVYDQARSEKFNINVIKSPVVGRVYVDVIPPAYTGIDAFTTVNAREISIPERSSVRVSYTFKNAPELKILFKGWNDGAIIPFRDRDTLQLMPIANTEILSFADSVLLNTLGIEVIKDRLPEASLVLDSNAQGVFIRLNANDDYRLTRAELHLKTKEETIETVPLGITGGILNAEFFMTKEEIALLKELELIVFDNLHSVKKKIDLSNYQQEEKNESDLLNAAGNEINALREEQKEQSNDRVANSSKKKQSPEDRKKQAEQIEKVAEQLVKKDSVQYDRFKELSEKLNELIEKLDKNIPESEKRMTEKQMEETLAKLEKEWAILKAIEELKQLDKALEEKRAASEENINQIQESKEDLEKVLGQEEKEKLDWNRFDSLKANNEQLAKEQNANENESEQKQEAEEQNKQGEQSQQKEPSNKNTDKQQEDIKQQMKEDSDALKQQLSELSTTMMMDAMQKNVELLRRLELRSLKASKKQEEIHQKAKVSTDYDQSLLRQQKEVSLSARNILDSISVLTVTDPMLANVLAENKQLLTEHLRAIENTNDMPYTRLVTNQRYLQFSLNDLASILYDILKSESESMQSMMAGNKQCNKPKSGKGQKESLSKKQKELGEKMGKVKKDGQGNPEGRQTLSQQELLELIKGQEEIIKQFEQKGGKSAGDKDVLDQLNKQLDDLINQNLDKAINRNKDIEDKLITLEKSENQKKEDEEKRKSRESTMDYDAIRKAIIEDYIKQKQTGSRIVNLPPLKSYYTGKWIKVIQE